MRKFILAIAATITSIYMLVSCSTIQEATYRGVSTAVGEAVEREVYRGVSSMLAGYTSGMLYQLAYTQAFMVGGYAIGGEDFNEGQGSTWRIEASDGEATNSFTTERALLKKNDDGSSWWYLRYQPEGEDAIEYEIKMNAAMQPLEMYMKNPESGEVDHHEFDIYDQDREMEEQQKLEEDGYHTGYFHLEDWEQYREGTERFRVGSFTFDATILFYDGKTDDEDEDVEVRWWVAEGVPGELLKYEMKQLSQPGGASGEMIDLRDDYRPKFASW